MNHHWRRMKVETTGATQDYKTLISRLFETFLDFETKKQVAPPSLAPLYIILYIYHSI